MSSMLTRSKTLPVKMAIVLKPQQHRLQRAAVDRQRQRQLDRVDRWINSPRRTTVILHTLGARKEKEAPCRKEAREVCPLAGNLQE